MRRALPYRFRPKHTCARIPEPDLHLNAPRPRSRRDPRLRTERASSGGTPARAARSAHLRRATPTKDLLRWRGASERAPAGRRREGASHALVRRPTPPNHLLRRLGAGRASERRRDAGARDRAPLVTGKLPQASSRHQRRVTSRELLRRGKPHEPTPRILNLVHRFDKIVQFFSIQDPWLLLYGRTSVMEQKKLFMMVLQDPLLDLVEKHPL